MAATWTCSWTRCEAHASARANTNDDTNGRETVDAVPLPRTTKLTREVLLSTLMEKKLRVNAAFPSSSQGGRREGGGLLARRRRPRCFAEVRVCSFKDQ